MDETSCNLKNKMAGSSGSQEKDCVLGLSSDFSGLGNSGGNGGGGSGGNNFMIKSEQKCGGGVNISGSGGKGDSLEQEINQRISTVYRSIETLERKRVNFDKSLRAAARRTQADLMKLKLNEKSSHSNGITRRIATTAGGASGGGGSARRPSTGKPREIGAGEPAFIMPDNNQLSQGKTTGNPRIPKKSSSSRIIDVTRTYPKMFGLDPMKVIASSEDESSSSSSAEAGGDAPGPAKAKDQRSVKDRSHGVGKTSKKSLRKYLQVLKITDHDDDEPLRDLSAIMPSVSEKTFLTKLQRRESQLSKEINDMRTNLDVMNVRAEREAKKAQLECHRKTVEYFLSAAKNRPNNIIAGSLNSPSDLTKGPSRELTDFLQATGGPTAGWESADHQIFLRGHQKWSQDPPTLLENLARLLPNKKPEDIVEHTTWYEKFERLNNAHRVHIRRWQAEKKRENHLAIRMESKARQAATEKQKSHQELLKMRRAEERDREKEMLENWKRAKASGRSGMRSRSLSLAKSDNVNTTYRISKMDAEMSVMRKEIREITSMTRDMSRSLKTLAMKEGNFKSKKSQDRLSTAASDASSGFCEMTMEEIQAVAEDLEGDGERFIRRTRVTTRGSRTPTKLPSAFPPIDPKLRRDPAATAEGKKLLENFRARDDEMLSAKRKAIECRRRSMRNPAFLTDKQVRDRMRKISAPSKVSEPTKGWRIRQEMRELEKIEIENSRRCGSGLAGDHAFSPVPLVNNIPKLGKPEWRRNLPI